MWTVKSKRYTVTPINMHLYPVEQPEMTCGWFNVCAPNSPVEWINHELRGSLLLIDKSGHTTLHSFYFFKSKLVEWHRNCFFLPSRWLSNTIPYQENSVKQALLQKTRNGCALYACEKQLHIWANAQQEMLAGGLGVGGFAVLPVFELQNRNQNKQKQKYPVHAPGETHEARVFGRLHGRCVNISWIVAI